MRFPCSGRPRRTHIPLIHDSRRPARLTASNEADVLPGTSVANYCGGGWGEKINFVSITVNNHYASTVTVLVRSNINSNESDERCVDWAVEGGTGSLSFAGYSHDCRRFFFECQISFAIDDVRVMAA